MSDNSRPEELPVEPKTTGGAPKPPRDLTREDADSPNGIPLYPPQGDGS